MSSKDTTGQTGRARSISLYRVRSVELNESMAQRYLKSALYLSLLFLCSTLNSSLAQDQAIFTDSLQNGWLDWGWASINYNNSSPVHSGSRSVAVTITDNSWQAIYIAHADFNSSPYSSLTLWINGGASGGQQLQVVGHAGDAVRLSTNLPPLVANTWQQYSIPLATLGLANRTDVDGIWIQDRVGAVQPTFYLDDIYLTTSSVAPPTVTLTSPANGSSYAAPASIPLAANVVSNGHSITKVQFYNGSNLLDEDSSSPYSFTWTGVAIGSYSLFARVIYDSGASADSAAAAVTVTGTSSISITVDAQLNRHPISPLIYGTCFASATQLSDLNCPLNRSGGNAETRYNWATNAHNRGRDWYFESIADSPATPGAAADDFVSLSKTGGAEPAVTIPIIGWMPKLAASRGKLASYSTNKYGPQTDTDWQWMPSAGNGISVTNNTPITWNDPNDANFLTNSTFQQGYVRHLTNRWGLSTNGGVRHYIMDNEHSIWHSTHRDVHPNGAGRAEIRDKFFDYAGMVKAIDPNALVWGPEEFGWSGYFNSGADLQWGEQHNWTVPSPDRTTNGNMDYVCWLLKEFHQRDTNTNQRLLDYFTLHRYTEDDNVGGSDVSTATQLKRNRWTRSFWDTNYVDESWIGSQTENKVMLIPRMKNWVATYYPGTKIGITEYNWGAESHINGATTQADILGIYGREGLDLATRWTTPPSSSPTYKAMKMFRNYDGNKSCFGDISVGAAGPNPDNVSPYAAVRSADGALTLMVINKQLTAAAAATVNLANFIPAGIGQAWQLTAANSITRLSDISFSGATFTSTVPAQSITLFVLPAVALAGPPTSPSPGDGTTGVATNTNLSWTAGTNATAHQLYFGTSSNAVAYATTNSLEFKATLATTHYTPGALASSGRFYWRVDELAGSYVTTGPVWTFATGVNPSARFPLAGSLSGGGSFTITFPSQLGQTYRVERSDSVSPASWSTVADNMPGTGSAILILDSGMGLQRQQFYRALILPP